MKTGILWDELFLKHDTGLSHPESKERLLSIRRGLETYPHLKDLKHLGLRPATEAELRLVHPATHIRAIQHSAGKAFAYLDPDTAVSEASYEVAVHAVGGVLQIIESLMSGEIDNGFAFVRPPGHHAEPERAMGFCLFSNVALGAAYALKRYGLERVLVVDFDVHHGNGTQKTFYHRRDVLFISTHQFPLFPGTGAFPETGSGPGKGFTLNFPLPAGTGDVTYGQLFDKIILPVAKAYRPQLMLVSAGFDAYVEDPLAGMRVTPEGFASMARHLKLLADTVCQGENGPGSGGRLPSRGIAEKRAAGVGPYLRASGTRSILGPLRPVRCRPGQGPDPLRGPLEVLRATRQRIRLRRSDHLFYNSVS